MRDGLDGRCAGADGDCNGRRLDKRVLGLVGVRVPLRRGAFAPFVISASTVLLFVVVSVSRTPKSSGLLLSRG